MGLLQILGLGPQPQLQPAGLPVSSQDTVNATGSGKAPAVDKNKQAFDTARAAMKLLVDGIANHPQKDEITAQVDSARAKLKDADDQATAKAWPAATKLLGEVKTICQAAKKLADDWQKYKRERTSLLAAGMSFSSQDSKNNENWAQDRIDEANLLVTQTPPKFDAALQVLKKAMAQLKPIVKQLLDTAQARLKTLEKTKTALKAFAQNELDQGRQLIASAQASFDAGEWSACRTTALHALRFVAPAIRMVEGRGVFEEERAKAVAAIAKVRAADAVKDQATALDSPARGRRQARCLRHAQVRRRRPPAAGHRPEGRVVDGAGQDGCRLSQGRGRRRPRARCARQACRRGPPGHRAPGDPHAARRREEPGRVRLLRPPTLRPHGPAPPHRSPAPAPTSGWRRRRPRASALLPARRTRPRTRPTRRRSPPRCRSSRPTARSRPRRPGPTRPPPSSSASTRRSHWCRRRCRRRTVPRRRRCSPRPRPRWRRPR